MMEPPKSFQEQAIESFNNEKAAAIRWCTDLLGAPGTGGKPNIPGIAGLEKVIPKAQLEIIKEKAEELSKIALDQSITKDSELDTVANQKLQKIQQIHELQKEITKIVYTESAIHIAESEAFLKQNKEITKNAYEQVKVSIDLSQRRSEILELRDKVGNIILDDIVTLALKIDSTLNESVATYTTKAKEYKSKEPLIISDASNFQVKHDGTVSRFPEYVQHSIHEKNGAEQELNELPKVKQKIMRTPPFLKNFFKKKGYEKIENIEINTAQVPIPGATTKPKTLEKTMIFDYNKLIKELITRASDNYPDAIAKLEDNEKSILENYLKLVQQELSGKLNEEDHTYIHETLPDMLKKNEIDLETLSYLSKEYNNEKVVEYAQKIPEQEASITTNTKGKEEEPTKEETQESEELKASSQQASDQKIAQQKLAEEAKHKVNEKKETQPESQTTSEQSQKSIEFDKILVLLQSMSIGADNDTLKQINNIKSNIESMKSSTAPIPKEQITTLVTDVNKVIESHGKAIGQTLNKLGDDAKMTDQEIGSNIGKSALYLISKSGQNTEAESKLNLIKNLIEANGTGNPIKFEELEEQFKKLEKENQRKSQTSKPIPQIPVKAQAIPETPVDNSPQPTEQRTTDINDRFTRSIGKIKKELEDLQNDQELKTNEEIQEKLKTIEENLEVIEEKYGSLTDEAKEAVINQLDPEESTIRKDKGYAVDEHINGQGLKNKEEQKKMTKDITEDLKSILFNGGDDNLSTELDAAIKDIETQEPPQTAEKTKIEQKSQIIPSDRNDFHTIVKNCNTLMGLMTSDSNEEEKTKSQRISANLYSADGNGLMEGLITRAGEAIAHPAFKYQEHNSFESFYKDFKDYQESYKDVYDALHKTIIVGKMISDPNIDQKNIEDFFNNAKTINEDDQYKKFSEEATEKLQKVQLTILKPDIDILREAQKLIQAEIGKISANNPKEAIDKFKEIKKDALEFTKNFEKQIEKYYEKGIESANKFSSPQKEKLIEALDKTCAGYKEGLEEFKKSNSFAASKLKDRVKNLLKANEITNNPIKKLIQERKASKAINMKDKTTIGDIKGKFTAITSALGKWPQKIDKTEQNAGNKPSGPGKPQQGNSRGSSIGGKS